MTRRQVKNLTIVLTNKRQQVQTVVFEKENVCCCIDWNELILGNLKCVESRNKKCSCICIGWGESQTYAVNQSLCRQGRRNVSIEKVECKWGGDSRVKRLLSKSAVRRLRWICVMLNVAGVAVDVLAYGWAVLLCLGPQRNLVFYNSLCLKSDQIWSFFIFYRKGRRLIEELLLILFFVRNSINISLCSEPMYRDAFFFFSFLKIFWSRQHLVSALQSIRIAIILFVQ